MRTRPVPTRSFQRDRLLREEKDPVVSGLALGNDVSRPKASTTDETEPDHADFL